MAARPVETLTTEWGSPAPSGKHSLSAGVSGPLLLADTTLVSTLAHFDRERIPERVVHAKGAGAHGYFEVTHDISGVCKADVFSAIGKRTPAFVRFSTVGGERGSADTERDPRGFAVKLYTGSGNWDIVGNNTPVFFVRDPLLFPALIHTQKRDPRTNLKDADMFWDFFASVPESMHQVMILFGDRGTPASYRHMNGYSSHTLRFVNAAGVGSWVKIHFKSVTGVKNFTAEEAEALKATDADWATRDLYEHIAAGGTAEWKMCIQVMTEAEAAKFRFNPFDITKVWPQAEFPLLPVGRLVLNRNPINYFAEVEQAAFSPGHMVPGVEPSPDKMLQARLFSYPDTHRHRLGANYLHLPINCPFASRVRNHQRDGAMCLYADGEPNYFTGLASTGGAQVVSTAAKESALPLSGVVGRYDQTPTDPDADFVQPRALYQKVMNDAAKARLVSNIAGHLKNARVDIQVRILALLSKVDPVLSKRVEEGIAARSAAARPASASAAARASSSAAGR